MLRYVCDWCKRAKRPGEDWVLGFAAERQGVVTRRRELRIARAWADRAAQDPLAVHFCCEEHLGKYMKRLFGEWPPAASWRKGRAAATRRHAKPRGEPADLVRAHGLGVQL